MSSLGELLMKSAQHCCAILLLSVRRLIDSSQCSFEHPDQCTTPYNTSVPFNRWRHRYILRGLQAGCN